MKTGTIETWLYRYDEDTDVEKEMHISVDYTFLPGSRGARDTLCGVRGAGPPLEPDDPPEIEVSKILDLDTQKEVKVTDDEYEKIIDAICEQMEP